MKSTVTGIVGVFMFCCVSAYASPIFYTASGVFSATTPGNAMGFSGPGAAWSFSFEADTNPTVLVYTNGGFNFAFSDFQYALNGSPVAIAATFIRFFADGYGGGFEICFNGTIPANCTDAVGSHGPQMFAGTTSSPTLLPGAFVQTDIVANVDSVDYSQDGTTVQATIPEPSMFLPLAAGLLALTAWRFRTTSRYVRN